MTEEDARRWIEDHWGVERASCVAAYVDMLIAESRQQNLVSAASINSVWSRHIVDSAQLILLASDTSGTWVDIGSGAGLPGIVVAILANVRVVMVEPRKLRVAFLERVIDALELPNACVIGTKSAAVRTIEHASVISARAVAALPALLSDAVHMSGPNTLWLLPKGQNARSEVAAARATWHGVFHVEPSMTDPTSGIIVARGVKRR